MEMRLEVVPLPVSDVDAAKAFYTEKVGFELDHDVEPTEGMRVVQMTPPGSACSVVIGEGLPLGEPGSVKGVQLVVDDVDAVRAALSEKGVEVGEVRQLGPEGAPGSRFVFFEDPDGNVWSVQELKRERGGGGDDDGDRDGNDEDADEDGEEAREGRGEGDEGWAF
jgi:catechol 2,3-dioxygenase-like lactoylglutathione lyase family enzyme